MKLYSYWRSSAAYRVRIALALKGLDYDYEAISLIADGGAHRQAPYAQRNPQKLVPFLEDGNVSISQSLAILEYLDETYPEPGLLPPDPASRAWVRSIAQIICCDIHPIDNLRILQYLQDPLGIDKDDRDDWYRHWIIVGFEAIESLLASKPKPGPYCFGNQVTLADICLIPQLYNARRFNTPLDNYPLICAIDQATQKIEAFEAALPENQPDATN